MKSESGLSLAIASQPLKKNQNGFMDFFMRRPVLLMPGNCWRKLKARVGNQRKSSSTPQELSPLAMWLDMGALLKISGFVFSFVP